MNEQELNKKLAIWAGFRQPSPPFTYWKCPPNISPTVGRDNPPKFTQSLDACFKWLVPTPLKDNPDVQAILTITFDYDSCSIIDIIGKEFRGESEFPALALCLAIEKLIYTDTQNKT
jgi:hypothetical protein